MNELERLACLIRSGVKAAAGKTFSSDNSLDKVIEKLERYTKAGASTSVQESLQLQAVQRFWKSQRFDNLKDARLVSFGLCVPSNPSEPCIMEDRMRFQAVLDGQTGVGQWLDDPRRYRRCYQGLLRSYFAYKPKAAKATAVGSKNWSDLRDYLHDKTGKIFNQGANPDWVTTTLENQNVFLKEPCTRYAESVLQGDISAIEQLCERLGITQDSWFLEELLLAQVLQATKFGHEQFKELIPIPLELLAKNHILRDRGLILMLDKYVTALQPILNEPLRNASVDWWGNPWLPSNEMRWGGVVPAAREMVSEWLKREFIEAFFAKLAADGVGDRRRANFWLRYVKSMDNVQFALGARALNTQDRDFVALRAKMRGLYTELNATDSTNNAFVMTMGNLVAVEFGGMGNAFYGYDVRGLLPFDMKMPVNTTVNARNSLKHSNRLLWMQHQDGIHGWRRWEEMFEATLEEKFGIRPNATKRSIQSFAPPATPEVQETQPRGGRGIAFTMTALQDFAARMQLRVDDLSARGGNIWVRTDNKDNAVNNVLLYWEFTYKPSKGWWRRR